MRISIVGPGALGLLLYARLRKTAVCVELVDYKKVRIKRLSCDGIMLNDSQGKKSSLSVQAGLLPHSPRLIISAVKAGDIKKSFARIRKFIGGSYLLPLQNGMGWEKIYGRFFPESRIIRGLMMRGAALLGENSVRESGRGEIFMNLMKETPEGSSMLRRTAALLRSAGFPVKIRKDMDKLIWQKLVLNSALNPVASLSGLSNGKAYENRRLRRIMILAGREALDVAEKEGVKLTFSVEKLLEKVCSSTYNNINSMLQDLRAGRKTEIEFLNGYLLRIARRRGVSLPVSESLYRLVKTLENRNI